jgi:hypothetical protein
MKNGWRNGAGRSCGCASGSSICELWTVIDCRETCIKLSGADFTEQLERIDREIEQALRR